MKKAYKRLCEIEMTLAMIFLVISTALIFLAAVLRYVGWPLNWSLEMSQFIFAWCVFLSADVALRENRMVNLDLFVNRLPGKGQAALAAVCYVIILVFLAVLVYFGFLLTWKTRVRTFQGIDFSYAWVTVSLPIASILMGMTTVNKLRECFRTLAGGASDDKGDSPCCG